MSRPNYLQAVKKRIEAAPNGFVFVAADFADVAENQRISDCLYRLEKEKIILRVLFGVYYKPEYSSLLGEYIAPAPDAVAHALARNFGWTIVPCGDTALNMLGLSTQIPAVWLYVSDGPYKTYETDGVKFQFKHTDRKNELIGVSETTALIIQALRALGKESIDSQTISFLSSKLDAKEKQQILQESRYVTAWIYEAVKEICGGSEA